MKLLFLTEFYPRDDKLIFTGGVETRDYYVAERAKKDFEVQIISSTSSQVSATPKSIFSRLVYIIRSLVQAVSSDFDLIEASNVVTYLPAYLAAKIKNKPAIVWVPDILGKHWFDFGWAVGFFGFLAEKIYLKLNWTKIIALSESTKTKLIDAGVNPGKISMVRAGIDPKEFNFTRPQKFSRFTIICVARLVKTKRLDQLMKLPFKLIIVGTGPEEKKLKDLAGANVIFYKNLSRQKLLELISRCHLFCLPSVVEGFGIATIEAMACGLPAVLADIPVNREITNNGQGSIFFEPGNAADLLIKIKDIRKIYQQKQSEALKLAKTYTWDKIYAQTKKVYETCFHY